MTRLPLRLCAFIFPVFLTTANATTFKVSPDGEPMFLTDALLEAGAGDTISLGDGIYSEPIVTMNAGEEGSPLVIEGGRNAIINGFSGNRTIMWDMKVVDIRHSWTTLRGFTVDAQIGDRHEEESYVDKCIWVEGQAEPTMLAYRGSQVKSSLIGAEILDMKIQNCGMEGIRIRNFVTNMVIKDNDIDTTGIWDFRYRFDGKVGEAIYIGTSSNQWTDGAPGRVTNGEDKCNYNLVTGNTLHPHANECVDIKEGSSMNVIEYNDCFDQRDDESGCYDSRGNGNVFRYNTADQCAGAGIRLGGHVIDGFVYGVDNDVYGNDFTNTEYGSIKSMQHPQGIICGNTCSDGECRVKEKGQIDGEVGDIEASWDQECPSSLPAVPFIDTDMDEEIPATTTEMPQDYDAALPEYKMLGCFADRGNGRVMQYKLNDQDLTTESCALECEGFAFFGTQYGMECWCGGDETDHVQHGESELCDFECAGDASDICGGTWAMNVYEYTSAPATLVFDSEGDDDEGTTTTTAAECDGVLSPLGYYCCASSCSECGGSGCTTRDGGAAACCTNQIKAKGDMCDATDGAAPCIVEEFTE